MGFLWLSLEFRIKQAWALQCDPDEIKCNQDEGRTTIIQVELYTLIFLKYWLGIWIWIKDLGSVSVEDWNLQWDLEHIRFLFSLRGSGVCKLCFGSLVHPGAVARKGNGHILLPEAPDGRSAVPEESSSLEHKRCTSMQWHSWEYVTCVSVFWIVKETSHGRGCPFLSWGLELFLFLVWDISSRSGRAWLESPGSQGRMEAEHVFHHPNRSRVFPLISSCLKLPEAPSKFLEIKRHCQVQYHGPVA